MQTTRQYAVNARPAPVLLALLLGLLVGCVSVSEGSTPNRRRVARDPAPATQPAAEPAAPTAPSAGAATSPPLRLISWNMEWLNDEPGRGTVKRSLADYQAFAGYAAEIDPDIAVLQEVDSETAVRRVFDASRYNIYVTQESGVQRVALVWKRAVDLRVVDELEALGPGGLRESPDALVQTAAGAFRLLGVHLKSSCFEDNLFTSRKEACTTLREQLGIVEGWMEARHAEGVPFAVAGDFNRRFSPKDDGWRGLDDGRPTGFRLVAPTTQREARCRDGRYRDFIDHIVLSGTLAARMVSDSFRQWNYRAWDPPTLSDHCPIGIELR